jgi:lipoyl(octanoyl) transferase
VTEQSEALPIVGIGRRPLEIRHLGRVGYRQAANLQIELVHERREGLIPDLLLLLQHPHVITMGSSAKQENILLSADELKARGIDLCPSGRGGDVTYHGPGQIVGYPILDLKPGRCDLHRYLRDLEEVMIRVLADFGLEAGRKEGLTGAWLGDRKVGAIGVRVSSGWITSHGFSLNVNPDLRYFETIVPCGISEFGVGSMAAALGRPLEVGPVEARVAVRFREMFGQV